MIQREVVRSFFSAIFLRCACRRGLSAGAGLVPQAGAVFFYLTEVFRSRKSEMFFCGGFSRCACRRSLPAGAGLAPRAGVGFFYLTEVFRLRESELFFLRFFLRCACRRGLSAGAGLVPRAGAGFFYLTEVFRSRESEMFFCGIFRDVRADAACLLARACSSCRGGFFYLTEVFCSRESELFFFAGFFAMCVQAQLACWRGLAPQAGAGPAFLDEKKGSKDSPRGEFRFSPPWNPHSTTKGAAFGNREKLPLWFLLTHRHSLRVKRVRKESCHVCNWYGKRSQANKKMRRSRIPQNCELTRAL